MLWNMMISRMPDSSIRLSLKYNGPEVDDGSMPLSEVVSALQGFAGAYGKVADSILPDSTHELRVTAVRQSSFDLHILAWLSSKQAVTVLHDLESIGKAAGIVFALIKGYISVKKHLKGDRYEIAVSNGNTRLVINRAGESMEVPQEVIELLQSKTLDADLEKVVAPLEQGKVDSAEITAVDGESINAVTVTSEERGYFFNAEAETKEEVNLIGQLISNNKENLRGTFEVSDGTRLQYHYSGPNPEQFQSIYAYRGSVSVRGIATIDNNLTPRHIEIKEAIRLQRDLDL
jgi:hypothetical protein